MTTNFQNKFKNQIQSIGKSGIIGTMNNNSVPHNKFTDMSMPGAISQVSDINPKSKSKSKSKIPHQKKTASNGNKLKSGAEMIMQTNPMSNFNNENKSKINKTSMTINQPPNMYPMQMMSYQNQMANPMPMQMNPYMYMPMNPYMNNQMPMANNYAMSFNNPNAYQSTNMFIPEYQMSLKSNKTNKINNSNKKESNSFKRKEDKKNNANDSFSENKKRVPSGRAKYVEYTPYTLKDYKDLTSTNIVMGPLGANIGTDEWNEKKEKMKRMENYSNKINQNHQGLHRIKKDTPKEQIEKDLKKKVEDSTRYKTYEYGKLIRSFKYGHHHNPNIDNKNNKDAFYNDLGIINENEEIKINNVIRNNNFTPLLNKDNDTFKNTTNNNLIEVGEKIATPIQSSPNIANKVKSENEQKNDLELLLQQREMYKAKINDIKESLL